MLSDDAAAMGALGRGSPHASPAAGPRHACHAPAGRGPSPSPLMPAMPPQHQGQQQLQPHRPLMHAPHSGAPSNDEEGEEGDASSQRLAGTADRAGPGGAAGAGSAGTHSKAGGISKKAWSAEEDEILSSIVRKHGAQKWSTVASYLPGRVGKQCR